MRRRFLSEEGEEAVFGFLGVEWHNRGMRYSELFGKTTKDVVKDASFRSHQLLVQAGFIRESVAGRYFFLPLGWRVHEKIKRIIKEEMDKSGAQEMISPVLHPLELWEETNRTNTAGFELMQVIDRRGARFALGGTAEEMFVDVARKFQLSYRDLPFNIYQFSTKFRDELRARGGLLRVREFVMKDAYSFDRNEAEFRKTYARMAKVYTRIFERLGLKTEKVAADNGYIGGEYCHEYQVEYERGEGKYFVSEDGEYVAHEDVAEMVLESKNADETMKTYEEVEVKRGKSMADGQAYHKLPMWQQLKAVLYTDNEGKYYMAVIRGDLTVNENKLLKATGAYALRLATEDEVREIGSVPGFISPVGVEEKVMIVADKSIETVRNFYGGANKDQMDGMNINLGRDFQAEKVADIAVAEEGAEAPGNHGKLRAKRGIEVGNIFQLGYHYSTLMSGATFTDEDGTQKPYYMGCYGIGLGRTMATIAELYHDEKGLQWPEAVAPYQVHLVSLGKVKAELVYDRLSEAGVEVLWDDRETVRAGEKFADADLIGCPVRLVISEKTGEKVEWKRRGGDEVELLSLEEVVERLGDKVAR